MGSRIRCRQNVPHEAGALPRIVGQCLDVARESSDRHRGAVADNRCSVRTVCDHLVLARSGAD